MLFLAMIKGRSSQALVLVLTSPRCIISLIEIGDIYVAVAFAVIVGVAVSVVVAVSVSVVVAVAVSVAKKKTKRIIIAVENITSKT